MIKTLVACIGLLPCLSAAAPEPSQTAPSVATATADPTAVAVGEAIERAARFLLAQQQADGSWRSDHYAQFANGVSLTAHNAVQLHRAGHLDTAARDAAIGFLLNHHNGLPLPDEPVHTTALALKLLLLADTPDPAAIKARLDRLTIRRLSAANGHPPGHPDHGGWSYALIDPPFRDTPADPSPFSANISATRFAIDAALAVHRHDPDLLPAITLDEWITAAAELALRCQNTCGREPATNQPSLNNGGFFFSPSDPALNKAGAVPSIETDITRFHSYGSATTDALLLLLRTGHDPGHPPVKAGIHWLRQRVSGEPESPHLHPGHFPADREDLRLSYEYYYLMNAAALLEQSSPVGAAEPWRTRWAAHLRATLLERQRPDGSWSNPAKEGREDDPLVATPMALAALATLLQLR